MTGLVDVEDVLRAFLDAAVEPDQQRRVQLLIEAEKLEEAYLRQLEDGESYPGIQ